MRFVAVVIVSLALGCDDDAATTATDPSSDVSSDMALPAMDAGPAWHSVSVDVDGGDPLRAVWADSTHAWAVGGSSLVVRFDSETPSVESAPPGYVLRGIAGAASLYAVGDSGAALKRVNNNWTDLSPGGATLNAAWGEGPSAIMAAGASGTVMLYDAAGWKSRSLPVTSDLFGIWVQSTGTDSIIYVVGANGTIEHASLPYFDGWISLTSGTTVTLFGVWADQNQVVVVGDNGVILRSTDGTTFVPESSGTTATLFGVSGAGGELRAVGAGGVIVHRVGNAWNTEKSGGADLHSIWEVSSQEAWAVGDNTVALHLR